MSEPIISGQSGTLCRRQGLFASRSSAGGQVFSSAAKFDPEIVVENSLMPQDRSMILRRQLKGCEVSPEVDDRGVPLSEFTPF